MSTSTIPPVLREVVVQADPVRAFTAFTAELGRWWPRATHSVAAERARTVTVDAGVGGAIVETDDTGERHLWGTISVWDPGVRVVFGWHPGRPAEEATEVEVRFRPEGTGTRVVLEHRGWERVDTGAARRARYDDGWIPVLVAFAAHADAP